MVISGVRVVVADIPLSRPHHMSFATLPPVNLVFVRLETADGLVGWGEAACLGGPTWSEESAESVASTVERYIAPWLRGRDAAHIEAVRLEMARRIQGNPVARAAVEMALWDLNGRALGVPVMADESCCSPEDALAIARLGGVGLLSLKPAKSAGIAGAMAVARIAAAAAWAATWGA